MNDPELLQSELFRVSQICQILVCQQDAIYVRKGVDEEHNEGQWVTVTANMGNRLKIAPIINSSSLLKREITLTLNLERQYQPNGHLHEKLLYTHSKTDLVWDIQSDRVHRDGLFQLTLGIELRKTNWTQPLQYYNLGDLWKLILSFLLTRRKQTPKLNFHTSPCAQSNFWFFPP